MIRPKRMSERRSGERPTCLACKVFICVWRQKGDDVILYNKAMPNNNRVMPNSITIILAEFGNPYPFDFGTAGAILLLVLQ